MRESPLKQDNEFEKMNSSEIFGGHFTLENEVNTTTTTGFLGAWFGVTHLHQIRGINLATHATFINMILWAFSH